MSYKADIDLWDLVTLTKNATSVGYTRFDGTNFIGDGYVPLKLTTFNATIRRLKLADGEARRYVARKLADAGYVADGKPERERGNCVTFHTQTFTRGDDEWFAYWASDTEGTIWYYESVENGRVPGMPYGVKSGEALQWITENGA